MAMVTVLLLAQLVVAAAAASAAATTTAALPSTTIAAAAAPDQYSVVYDSPSVSSLGAMPLGNGRTSANTWVEASSGDLVLSLGLADAFDENSNLLKLGLIRLRLQPPLNTSAGVFNQTLVLSSATVYIRDGNGLTLAVWVDAITSAVRISVTPAADAGGTPVKVLAVLDHQRRLNSTVDAAGFGNGWGGASGSFCNADGTVASFVGIFPDKLHSMHQDHQAAVAWYHRNDPQRSDMYGDALKQQGLAECGPSCWDMLTNRSFGAALVADPTFLSVNATAISTTMTTSAVELAIGVVSAQTDTEATFTQQLEAAAQAARAALSPTNSSALRSAHERWWSEFYNRSWLHVISPPAPPPPAPAPAPPGLQGYVRHDGYAGDQQKLMRRPGWAHRGESPGNCSAAFSAPAAHAAPLSPAASRCVQRAAAMCDTIPGCRSFALSHAWSGGYFPQLYTDGMPGDRVGDGWVLFVNETRGAHTPPPPPASDGFLISRQNILMRFMDVCSSGRIGGGAAHTDYFALKYNGGILTAEPAPKEDYRAWGPGQWWQNLRLPYYTMLAEGGGDLFKPLLRWYLGILPLAQRRTTLWFNETDAAGRDLRGKDVHGAWFIETLTQFGTFVPAEKGYHCAQQRNSTWTVDWAGNRAINLHREGSVELLMLGLDYYEHTLDKAEFGTSILPLSVAVTDFVASYYGRTADGELDVWPTQSLEGYRPGSFPPTHNNTVKNDMPWVAGLHAVLPRLLRLAAADSSLGVGTAQLAKWRRLLSSLPPLPTSGGVGMSEVFVAAQEPYPPHAVLGGSEQPYMYAVHPYRLATVVTGGHNLAVGRHTMAKTKDSIGDGWKQGVMNAALLGLSDVAAAAVLNHALTPNGKMRFPAYLPSMQDFRPNEDHLSNMRSALQYMLVQHSDTNSSVFMMPSWPCRNWSVSFKLHVPQRTTVEGEFNHTTGALRLHVEPAARQVDVHVKGCNKNVLFE